MKPHNPILSLIPALLLAAGAVYGQYPQYPGAQQPQYPQPQYPGAQQPQNYPGAQQPGYPASQPTGAPGQSPNYQDQPGQPVARLSVINGAASVMRAESGEWTPGTVNVPLMAGDAISVPAGSRAELQFDNANFLRLDGNTELKLAAFDNGQARVQISRGQLTWRVLRGSSLDAEISTPVAAVHPFPLAAVRVEVAPDGSTRAVVRHGEIEVSSAKGAERVHEGSMISVRGDGQNADSEISYAAPPDGWDAWSDQRDAYLSRAQTSRYVSPDIYGAEDLDAAGRWGYDPEYGNVWTPNVPATWAPYREGQWVWSDFYGWTWVDAAPWGWAPYHYGSWYFRTGYGWSWFPGPRYGRYWWRPAMVSFFGFGVNIGWVPLAPFEVFHPWYGRGFRPFVAVGFGGGFGGVALIGSHRNAPFATAIAVSDFQRGTFNNRFVVNRVQLAQATVVRGALPVGPVAASRRAAVAPAPLGGRTFVSRQMPSQGVGRAAVSPAGNSWQRFGQTPSARVPGAAPYGNAMRPAAGPQPQGVPPRSLQVAPQMMRPREAGPAPAQNYPRPASPGPAYARPAAPPAGHQGGAAQGGHGGGRAEKR